MKPSCNARPDHTFGSITSILPRPRQVRLAGQLGHAWFVHGVASGRDTSSQRRVGPAQNALFSMLAHLTRPAILDTAACGEPWLATELPTAEYPREGGGGCGR